MQNKIEDLDHNGVHYYNIDNKDKENKVCPMHNDFLSLSSGKEADASFFPGVSGSGVTPSQAQPVLSQSTSAPTPPVDENQIKRALIQLFDNGTSTQRYKLKIKLNLVDGDNPEFIASLTKDMRNFRKYIPQHCFNEVMYFGKEITKNIKSKFNLKPYLGKLHFNQGRGRFKTSQIEPYTAVAVWWDPEHKAWAGMVMFYDWIYQFELFNDYISEAQAKIGLKSQTLYINPKYDTRQRPKTWAEMRKERNA